MSELAISAAREHQAEAIDQDRTSGEPVYVARRGRRVAVIVDADDYGSLVDAVGDALDKLELRAVRSEDDYVP
jgi:prevent-host-death family protein